MSDDDDSDLELFDTTYLTSTKSSAATIGEKRDRKQTQRLVDEQEEEVCFRANKLVG